MNYGQAETEIANHLNQRFSENNQSNLYKASPIPETEAEGNAWYSQINIARVSVEYLESTYDPDTGNDIARIVERARFRTVFESRKRRGAGGVYTLLELTKLYLIGFKPSNADRLTVTRFGLLEVSENAFQMFLEFECRTLNIQSETTDEIIIGGPFQQAFILET